MVPWVANFQLEGGLWIAANARELVIVTTAHSSNAVLNTPPTTSLDHYVVKSFELSDTVVCRLLVNASPSQNSLQILVDP